MAKASPSDPVSRGMLNEAVEAILEGIVRMFKVSDKKYNKRFEKIDKRFDRVEVKLEHSKNELKDDIGGLKADLSNVPSRRQFEELKSRVDKHHQLTG
ncbi:MAG: hypothetical protein ACC618_03135 [Patescibacteria group bacterium]